jgi:hypothetical protein
MLTKDDLLAIGNLIDQRIEPINRQLGSLEKGLQRLENKIDRVESRIVIYFDKRDIDHEKRIRNIETHLGLPHPE